MVYKVHISNMQGATPPVIAGFDIAVRLRMKAL